MASDSIANASSSFPISSSSSNPKDFAKKKRANRSAKLKQCKLDARREQWLSQVKNKGCKEEATGEGGTVHVGKEKGRSIQKLEIKPRGGAENDGLINNYNSNSDSPANSPTSHTSSVLESHDSGTNFTGSSSRSSSSSSSSGGCFSGSMSEEDDEGDEGCLDDWEAVADALAATDDKQEHENHYLHSPQESNGKFSRPGSRSEVNIGPVSGIDISEPKQQSGVDVPRDEVANCRAWRPDDAFRPQSLPNLTKQYSFPVKVDRKFCCAGTVWSCNAVSVPTSCPICYEDLDFTDTSFLPCSCGFRLCLFCHKRIIEEDGRCPGCRKQYECNSVGGEASLGGGSVEMRLARSYSMVTRS